MKILYVTLTIALSGVAFGQTTQPATVSQPATPTAGTAGGMGSSMNGAMMTGAMSSAMSGNVSGLATAAGAMGMTSAIQAGYVGTSLKSTCSSGAGSWACPLAAMALTAEVANLIESAKSNGTSSDVSAGTTTCDPSDITCATTPTTTPTTTTDTGGGLTPPPTAQSVQSALADLASQGYSYNPDTGMVTTPNGSYPAGDFANGQAMANAGIIPQSQVAAVDKAMKGVLDKYSVVAMAIKGAPGGGGSNSAQIQFYNPNAGLLKRRKTASAQTAGLTRQLANGEEIGSATDDIFAMVHRQYVKQTKLGEFIQK